MAVGDHSNSSNAVLLFERVLQKGFLLKP